jgi:hypothetical protein
MGCGDTRGFVLGHGFVHVRARGVVSRRRQVLGLWRCPILAQLRNSVAASLKHAAFRAWGRVVPSRMARRCSASLSFASFAYR